MVKKVAKKSKKLYKFLDDGLKSRHGDCTWKVGEWKHEDDINICGRGFHASKTPLQAIGYVAGSILAEVEVRGESMLESDKECWSDMRIKKAYHWTKEDSVSFAVYGAELVIENFEKLYPDDKRPREAIEAAKTYIKNPTEENREKVSAAASAARSAASAAEGAAWSAASAASAAEGAASAAEGAASAASAAWNAAWNAAWSAAEGAASAASAAEGAAEGAASAASAAEGAASAAEGALRKKLDKWFITRIKKLNVYED